MPSALRNSRGADCRRLAEQKMEEMEIKDQAVSNQDGSALRSGTKRSAGVAALD